jgi:quercetin dioxygenase-like cupin family protein
MSALSVDAAASDNLFAEASDAGWRDLGAGVRRRVRLHLPQMMMVEVGFEAGAVGAPHAHPHIQCSYVEKGAFDVTIGGVTRRIARGGGFIVPANAEHGVVALEPGLLIDVFTPQRDDFLDL